MSKFVVTISRQFGSGGSSIAKKLSEILNIPYLDKEILATTAQNSGISKEHFLKADERRSNSFLFSLVSAHYGGTATPLQLNDIITDDKLFLYTADTIKQLATNPCIIVGRCADDILTGSNIARLYVYSDLQDRVERIAKLYDINEKSAMTLIKKTDKKRASYYNFYTSKVWGEASNYDMCINSSRLGVDGTAEMFNQFLKSYEK